MTDLVPLPWVPEEAATVELGRPEDEGDVLGKGEVEEAVETIEVEDGLEGRVLNLATKLLSVSGLLSCQCLVLRRGRINKRGFVSGRVYHEGGIIHRLVMTTCPNSDWAEVAATLVHEFAHAVVGHDVPSHGLEFKQALVGLASSVWGDEFFAHVDVTRKCSHVDVWVASGIRASVSGGVPLEVRAGEVERRASVIRRVLKLRRLAEASCGEPEGISATAMANDLVATWDLFDVRADLDEGKIDKMCDRWVYIGKRQKWRRSLAWAVGAYFDVYILAQRDRGTLHWFGKLSAIEAGLHLFEVAQAHIERCLTEHLKHWVGDHHVRTEATNFRYSATYGLGQKLSKLKADEASGAVGETALVAYSFEAARTFAQEMAAKRGKKFRRGRKSKWSLNDAGVSAGRSVPMGRAIGGRGPLGQLK